METIIEIKILQKTKTDQTVVQIALLIIKVFSFTLFLYPHYDIYAKIDNIIIKLGGKLCMTNNS